MNKRKNDDKAKHPPRRRRRGWMIILAFCLGICGIISVLALLGPTIGVRSCGGGACETVSLLFTNSSVVNNTSPFSQLVILYISGTGQVADGWRDAFYLYRQNGQDLAEPIPQNLGFEIDGHSELAIFDLYNDEPPPYNPEHEYQVAYDVGYSRLIAFRIADDILAANGNGVFLIGIGQSVENCERVAIPFSREDATYTYRRYAGAVGISVSGKGQMIGESWSDAFYRYMPDVHDPRRPLQITTLEIDGQIISYESLNYPPQAYQTVYNHRYSVSYDIGETPHHIAFRIVDEDYSDNNGQLLITIWHDCCMGNLC